MLEKIEQLSKILNESYSEKSLCDALGDFFEKNFSVKNFDIITGENKNFNENYYFYPIYKHKKCIGSLSFSNESQYLKDFLDIAGGFISLKIQNIILNGKMQKDIEFHDTMKNIAKIIETQYELNYIIPLIGEMLDKFFPDYLNYVFLMDDFGKKCNLYWPSACSDKNIIEMVKNPEERQLSPDEKILTHPLISEGKVVGVLATKSTEDKISIKNMDYLEQLASQIAITIHRANVYGEILKHATLDALTGFYNRHQLEERIKQEVANAKRRHAPLCGIMTDIDYFKHVNDTYGHAVGDLVLKTIAKVIRSQLREYDVAGRYGGEEFSLLLPYTQVHEAKMVAERLRKKIEEKVIDISKVNPDANVKKISITISLGIYEIKANDSDEDLMKKADKALYQAKNTGRNKVVVNDD